MKKIYSILLVDLSIILLHLVFAKRLPFFSLDIEQSLPTIYSAIKLLLIGLVVFFVMKSKKKFIDKVLWFPIAFIFTYLAFDEYYAIHERLVYLFTPKFLSELNWFSNPVFYWPILFMPLLISAIIYMVFFIKRELRTTNDQMFYIIGTLFFGLVLVAEVVGGVVSGSNIGYAIMTLEESLEIFGTSFFLIATFRYYLTLNLPQKEKIKIS